MSVIDAMARAMVDADDKRTGHETCKHILRAALAESRKMGWQLVPVEPTDKMLSELWDNVPLVSVPRRESLEKCYRAMLLAAPSVEDA